jgi:hypothetical protein
MASYLITKLLAQNEYVSAEGAWILADNLPPLNLAKRFNAGLGREFVLLEKKLM